MKFKNGQPEFKYYVTADYPENEPVPCVVEILNTNDYDEAVAAIGKHMPKMKTDFHILNYDNPARSCREVFYYKGESQKNHIRGL